MNKIYSAASILAVMTFVSCKASDFQGNSQYADGNAHASSTTYKYLADSDAAAATSDASDSTTTSTAVDSTVSSDITDTRVVDMAARMMKDLDADSSGNLSLEEFLAGPEKFAAKANHAKLKALTDDQKAKMTDKLTTEFNSFAGDDVLLSASELQALLVAQAPRVAEYRRGGPGRPPQPRGKGGFGPGPHGQGGPNQFEAMQRPSEDELFKKYDVNGDGNLDAAEFKAMLQARFKPQDQSISSASSSSSQN
jgi:hypothetical protein